MIFSLCSKFNISNLCEYLGVSRSGYYKWLKTRNVETLKSIQDKYIKDTIVYVHNKYRGTYGLKRICIYINKNLDFTVNHKRVYRLMKELGIQSVIRKKVYRKKFKPSVIAKNILNRDFNATKPLEKLSMDITYIPIDRKQRKFIYLNAIKDLFNDEIVAYTISNRNDLALVLDTLTQLEDKKLGNNCMIHTDQGFQYTNKKYCKLLESNGITQSMSRRGNCWDNIPIEIFFNHLKSELIYLVDTNDEDELIKLVHEYIYFYNNERIVLKNSMSPVEYRIHTAN